jgi:hypothetical protein
MIHTDEDDEFERIAHEAKIKGQPYYFEPHPTDSEKLIFRKPSRKLDDDDIQDYVRPWVGLTNEEIAEFDTWHDNREEEVGWCNPSEIVAYIEAKLKEKNR